MGHPRMKPDGLGWLIGLPEHLSLMERWGRELRHCGRWMRLVLRNGGRLPPAVVAWPHLPSRRSVIHRVCAECGWELTNRPRRRAVLHLRFEDATEKASPLPVWFGAGGVMVLNAACTDIRKSTLERLHVAVFGYGLAVDPCVHAGPMLEKGDGNALHDGRVVIGPLLPANLLPDKVYQHVVDNTDAQGRRFDLRVGYIKGEFPIAYAKYKVAETPFTNETSAVEIRKIDAEFTVVELRLISNLLESLGVECAEIDVLRDAQSGRMHVVDVNPTPWGPPAGLAEPMRSHALAACAQSYANVVAQTPAGVRYRAARQAVAEDAAVSSK